MQGHYLHTVEFFSWFFFFFLFKDATEMKVNNILIGDFFIAISLTVAFSLQSEIDEIM